jgi:hypothetical protein
MSLFALHACYHAGLMMQNDADVSHVDILHIVSSGDAPTQAVANDNSKHGSKLAAVRYLFHMDSTVLVPPLHD